jgi:hypothetical protein
MLIGYYRTGVFNVVLQYGPQFYWESLFNHYHEVHAFELGLFAGIIVVAFTFSRFRAVSVLVLLGFFLLAIGFPNLHEVCRETGELCGSRPIQIKPWYFLSGLFGPVILIRGTVWLVFRRSEALSLRRELGTIVASTPDIDSQANAVQSSLSDSATQTDASAGGSAVDDSPLTGQINEFYQTFRHGTDIKGVTHSLSSETNKFTVDDPLPQAQELAAVDVELVETNPSAATIKPYLHWLDTDTIATLLLEEDVALFDVTYSVTHNGDTQRGADTIVAATEHGEWKLLV